MEIRKIELNDLDRVFELLNELYESKLKYEKFKEIYNLKLKDTNSYYIVAILNNKIVGILTSEKEQQSKQMQHIIFVMFQMTKK